MSFVPPPSRGQAGSSIEKEIERVKEECDELKGEIRREREALERKEAALERDKAALEKETDADLKRSKQDGINKMQDGINKMQDGINKMQDRLAAMEARLAAMEDDLRKLRDELRRLAGGQRPGSSSDLELLNIRCEFTERASSGFYNFRSILWQFLGGGTRSLPGGTCVRVGDAITVDFFVGGSDEAQRVVSAVQSAIRSAMVSTVEDKTSVVSSVTVSRVSKPFQASWSYNPEDGSPRKVHIRFTGGVPRPADLKKGRAEGSVTSGSSNDEAAHVVPQRDKALLVEYLLGLMGLYDGDARAEKERVNKITIALAHDDHKMFDKYPFYFAWRFTVEEAVLKVLLCPRIVIEEGLDIPKQVIREGKASDLEIWRHALVLRKYLTILIKSDTLFPAEMYTEWASSDNMESLCWAPNGLQCDLLEPPNVDQTKLDEIKGKSDMEETDRKKGRVATLSVSQTKGERKK
jgi:X-X-X-Leu-X-X-Gly heptad repeat protein